MAMIPMMHAPIPSTRFSTVRSQQQQEATILDHHHHNLTTKTSSNKANRLAESLSHLLHLHIDNPHNTKTSNPQCISSWNVFDQDHSHSSTPTTSPKEKIAEKWHEIHGSKNWEGLMDPLHPWLRREIVKYGEFAQATYDAFDFDSFSEFCGSCRYNKKKLFDVLRLSKNGYEVRKYIYAMSHIDMPNWLERSRFVEASWSKDSNWMGFVAVSNDEETKRIGRRDITVAWRGTVAPSEWYEDMQRKLEPIGNLDAKVEHGFLGIYKSKSDQTRYNKSSASEQVMKEVTRLVKFYKSKGEEVSITITGHSLGGALALLNAYEAAKTLPNVHISVISFGAPRVGNNDFRDELSQMGVKTLRIVVKQDVVPKMPGLVLNEGLQKFEEITGSLEWIYTHVGAEMRVDVGSSPYLKKKGFNFLGFHSLETYLHLVDGYLDKETTFRAKARRDVALVNKACDMLVEDLRIPHCWYQMENKGLVCNDHGRWVKPRRELEDIPKPTSELGEAQQQESHEALQVEVQLDHHVLQSLCTVTNLNMIAEI